MPEVQGPQVETRDISPRLIWLLGAGFAAFVLASSSGLLLFFHADDPWTFHRLAKPEPVLQISPAADYAAFIAQKRAALRGGRDRGSGLVEIPIADAMRLVAEGHRAEADVAGAQCAGAGCPAATPTRKTVP